jgi:hypothetical protein
MQLTKEQVDNQILKLQQEIPQMQNQLQQLIGYKQALIDIREQENSEENPE